MMCAVVIRRLKADSYEQFRKAWQPTSADTWPTGLSRVWIARGDDDPDVVATWGLFEDRDEFDIDAMRDDPQWMEAEILRTERIAPFEEELIASGYFSVVEEVLPPVREDVTY